MVPEKIVEEIFEITDEEEGGDDFEFALYLDSIVDGKIELLIKQYF